jgi:hypothetical protein
VPVHDPRTPDECLVVSGPAGGDVDAVGARPVGVAKGGDVAGVGGAAKRGLGVRPDHVDVVAAGEVGEGPHPAADVGVRGADEPGDQRFHGGEARAVGVDRSGVGGADRVQRAERSARGRRAARLAEDRARGGAARSGRERHQPDVLVEGDDVRAAPRQVRDDVAAQHALDLGPEAAVADDVREVLFELHGEHPRRLRLRVEGELGRGLAAPRRGRTLALAGRRGTGVVEGGRGGGNRQERGGEDRARAQGQIAASARAQSRSSASRAAR